MHGRLGHVRGVPVWTGLTMVIVIVGIRGASEGVRCAQEL